jgi:16S rRNA (uracil1498-N3)-methyltransferase
MHLRIVEKENYYLVSGFLSDIELYYSSILINDDKIILEGEECYHIIKVMRHKINDEIYITDGKGSIHKANIQILEQKRITCRIIFTIRYENKFLNITFCVPRLKSTDRFEFALEKCVELGITNFIVFDSQRTVAKGEKIERWEKILLAAMKQSLRAWLPKVSYAKSLNEIMKLEGEKILFDQNAEQPFNSILNSQFSTLNCYLIFGPEGGFTNGELKIENCELVRLTENRLRSETAIITAAVILSA